MSFVGFVLKLFFANALRFFRFFPNNDPILGLALPSARKNVLSGIVFAIIAMVSFDIITNKLGVWTLVTALTYAFTVLVLGLAFSKVKSLSIKHYFFGSIAGVLIFDAITGPGMSTFIFNQSFVATVLGQIPFTIYHLISASSYTLVFACLFDPVISRQVAKGLGRVKVFAPFGDVLVKFSGWVW